jgi:hypothetical protein
MPSIEDDMQKKTPIGLPWWALTCIIIGGALVTFLFSINRRYDLARPTLLSIVVIVFAVAFRWKLRRCVWFWITMLAIVAFHIALFLFVPWTTMWIPALALTPIAFADLAVIIAILRLVEKLMGPTQSDRTP